MTESSFVSANLWMNRRSNQLMKAFLCLVSLLLLLSSCAVVPGQAKRPDASSKFVLRKNACFHEAEESGKPPVSLAKLNPIWALENHNRPYDPWWKPNASHGWRKFTYALRNPGHNFTYYTIGIADRDFVRTGISPQSVWNEEGRTNLTMIHAGPLIHLPGISHKGRFLEGYFGWRERGNFGIALRLADPNEQPKKTPKNFGEDGKKKFKVRSGNPCVNCAELVTD